jgi:hypothetical protein
VQKLRHTSSDPMRQKLGLEELHFSSAVQGCGISTRGKGIGGTIFQPERLASSRNGFHGRRIVGVGQDCWQVPRRYAGDRRKQLRKRICDSCWHTSRGSRKLENRDEVQPSSVRRPCLRRNSNPICAERHLTTALLTGSVQNEVTLVKNVPTPRGPWSGNPPGPKFL